MEAGTKGADIASTGTMVIGTDGSYFDITGATGITAMTVDVGRIFTLQFDGAVVLTHSSTLYLAGAANFTTEANDHLTFVAVAANDVRQIGAGLKDGGSPVAAAGGSWILLCTTDASTASSVDFTEMDSTYDTYVMTLAGISCSQDWTHLKFRFGDSGGFDSGASDYARHEMRPDEASGNTYVGSSSASDTGVGFTHAIGNAAGEGYGGICYVHQPADSSLYPLVTFVGGTIGPASGLFTVSIGGGIRQADITLTGFQVLPADGTLSGRISIYGIAHA
jgi:hypothetical protein